MIELIVALLRGLLHDLFVGRSTTGRVTHGTTETKPTALDKIRERARSSGLLLLVGCLAVAGCGQTEVVVATLHPVEDTTKGWCRVAQDEVRVIVEGTETIGVVSPAGGYYLVHETDLRALVKLLKEK